MGRFPIIYRWFGFFLMLASCVTHPASESTVESSEKKNDPNQTKPDTATLAKINEHMKGLAQKRLIEIKKAVASNEKLSSKYSKTITFLENYKFDAAKAYESGALKLSHLKINQEDMSLLTQLNTVNSVILVSSEITVEALAVMVRSFRIERLDFKAAIVVGSDLARPLSELKHLKVLRINKVKKKEGDKLGRWGKKEYVALSQLPIEYFVVDGGTRLIQMDADEFVEVTIKGFKNLKVIDLHHWSGQGSRIQKILDGRPGLKKKTMKESVLVLGKGK